MRLLQVLIVEADSILRHALRRAVTTHGHEAKEASNLEEAKRLIGQSPHFDLYITEWHFQDGRGRDIIRYIRARQPSAQILLMTGLPILELQEEALALGVNDFLKKPFDIKEFFWVCKRLLTQKISAPLNIKAGEGISLEEPFGPYDLRREMEIKYFGRPS